jgi:hypothetical protein
MQQLGNFKLTVIVFILFMVAYEEVELDFGVLRRLVWFIALTVS